MALKSGNLRVPKNSVFFKIVIVERISTDKQDPRSLDDQDAFCRSKFAPEYPGEINVHVIRSQGSGEHLDRKELDELKDLIESGLIDLVIAEDLGRICRRNRAMDFCELCEDHNTRLFAINDHVDTEMEGWQDGAMMATWHHERSNRDTSSRIKRSLNNRFDQGQLMESRIYGYIVPPGAKSDLEMSKDPAAESVMAEIFRRLDDGATYAEVADWLNSSGVPLGPYCRSKKWTGTIVARLVHNRLLKGERIRNRLITERKNSTGRHKSQKADISKLRIRKCPHLAYFDAAYFDHVIAKVDARNQKYRRAKNGSQDCRKGVARCRTTFPGQHMRCGICGQLMYWTRCGKKRALICKGAQEYSCWNSAILTEDLCLPPIRDAIIHELRQIEDFDNLLEAAVAKQLSESPDDKQRKRSGLEQLKRSLEIKVGRLADSIAESPIPSPTLRSKVTGVEAEITEISYQIGVLDREAKQPQTIPTHAEIIEMLDSAFERSMANDQEAIRLLRRLVPEMHMIPYRCCDDTGLACKTHLTINLASLLRAAAENPSAIQIVTKKMIVDTFEVPQKVKHREACIELRKQKLTERQIAERLGITQPAVQNAFELNRKMQKLGLDDPYLKLEEVPTAGKCKFRRHLHPRFRFDPLDGFPLK